MPSPSQRDAGNTRALRKRAGAAIERGNGVARDMVAVASNHDAHDLQYVSDRCPGITRKRMGERFAYFDAAGSRIRDASEIARIDALAIPPAYTDVWICADPRGYLQATGRDARGRKQYRYHPAWRAVRDATKYERMAAFGEALPRVRRRVARDLRLRGMPWDKVVATVVRLLDITLVRVGNPEYAKENRSYGLTTLRKKHAAVAAGKLRFRFRGKSGVAHDVEVDDPRVASVVRRCLGLPGHELFQFVDENGTLRPVSSTDINTYLREASGADFTAKDYRTWAGSVLALGALRRIEAQLEREAEDVTLKKVALKKVALKKAAKNAANSRTKSTAEHSAHSGSRQRKGAMHRHLVQTIKDVAQTLRNTPAVCRRCYIHPAVVDAFEQGELHRLAAVRTRRGLKADEALFAQLLRRHARAMRAAAREATRPTARKRTPRSGGSGRSSPDDASRPGNAARSNRSSRAARELHAS